MTWTNAFAAGPCKVSVITPGQLPNLLWEGMLGLGEESPTFDVYSETMQVSVDGSGIITLSSSRANNADNFQVACEPQYYVAQLRATGITMNTAFATTGFAQFSDSDGQVLAIGVAGSCTPDPVESAYDGTAVEVLIAADAAGG